MDIVSKLAVQLTNKTEKILKILFYNLMQAIKKDKIPEYKKQIKLI